MVRGCAINPPGDNEQLAVSMQASLTDKMGGGRCSEVMIQAERVCSFWALVPAVERLSVADYVPAASEAVTNPRPTAAALLAQPAGNTGPNSPWMVSEARALPAMEFCPCTADLCRHSRACA